MEQVQITIRDLPDSPVIEDHIRKKLQKLTQFFQRITSCRVVIESPQKHKHNGKLYTVNINLKVPKKEIVVNHQQNEDVYVAIRDAFNALERQLEEHARKIRGEVKTHITGTHGTVARIFFDEGYGFIKGNDGNEYYFSISNVSYPSFDQLKVGDAVEFIMNVADDGLQANHITKDKHNHLVNETE